MGNRLSSVCYSHREVCLALFPPFASATRNVVASRSDWFTGLSMRAVIVKLITLVSFYDSQLIITAL